MTKTSKKGPGRPQFEPTPEQRAYVVRQRLAGATVTRLSAAVGVAEATLRLRFAAELEHATADLLGRLAWRAYELARAGDPAMIEFMLRSKGGFVERDEVSGAGGTPLFPGGPMVPGVSRARLRR